MTKLEAVIKSAKEMLAHIEFGAGYCGDQVFLNLKEAVDDYEKDKK